MKPRHYLAFRRPWDFHVAIWIDPNTPEGYMPHVMFALWIGPDMNMLRPASCGITINGYTLMLWADAKVQHLPRYPKPTKAT